LPYPQATRRSTAWWGSAVIKPGFTFRFANLIGGKRCGEVWVVVGSGLLGGTRLRAVWITGPMWRCRVVCEES
jgi:hypothetical protein